MVKKNVEGDNCVATNLRWLMRQARISQNALAGATTVKQPTINRILTGKNISPRDTTLHLLAKHFNVSVEDLRFKDLSDQSSLPQNLRGFRIPMISARQAGTLPLHQQWPDSINVYFEVSGEAFGMNISDRGMEPKFSPDDIVVIDKDHDWQPGAFVAARVEGLEEAVVRVYKATEYRQGKRHFVLLPLNDNFDVIKSEQNKIDILGPVVARWERML